jgi:hypothetical protein
MIVRSETSAPPPQWPVPTAAGGSRSDPVEPGRFRATFDNRGNRLVGQSGLRDIGVAIESGAGTASIGHAPRSAVPKASATYACPESHSPGARITPRYSGVPERLERAIPTVVASSLAG